MRARGRGQVGVLSSLAALDGFSALYPAYAATKAFATAWALGLRAHVRDTGVAVNVFAPGAVATPLLAPVEGLDPHYDPAAGAPAWVVPSPCGELSAADAAAAWAAGLARDEAVTRSHHCYSLVCTDACLGCPPQAHDLLMRNRCYMLWAFRPKARPQHAWLQAAASGKAKT